jgi:hypothetical protein
MELVKMKNYENLSREQADKLSLSVYLGAARRTLQELYERKCHFESNPPVSDVLHLSPEDRKFLAGIKVRIKETEETLG